MKRVFVLGAGTSVHAGAPLGKNIIRKYIEQQLADNSDIAKIVRNYPFLTNLLNVQPNNPISSTTPLMDLLDYPFPNLSDVLTYYQLANDRQEPFIKGLFEENNIFIEEIMNFVTLTIKNSIKERTTDICRRFVKSISSNDCIINFNYDTLIDNAIMQEYNNIDYGMDFALPNIDEQSMAELNQNENVPDTYFRLDKNKSTPLILKPHGSFNWLYCADCYDFYLKIVERFGIHYFPNECNNCQIGLHDYIVPFSYKKNFSNPLISNVWTNVVKVLSKADEVYFIGYSLSDDDYTTKYFFIKGISRILDDASPKLFLISPHASRRKDRFTSIFGNVSIVDGELGKFENLNLDQITTKL
jgi:hypothetical protein